MDIKLTTYIYLKGQSKRLATRYLLIYWKFTREISSRNETRLGMKSSLSMVKCLLLFTRFRRDEI